MHLIRFPNIQFLKSIYWLKGDKNKGEQRRKRKKRRAECEIPLRAKEGKGKERRMKDRRYFNPEVSNK